MTYPRTSIDVTVVSEYLHQQSVPEQGRYAFAYHITITNQTTLAAKLLTRHWIIVDANQERQEIHGSGVVGEQPIIAAGDHYKYTSGVILATPIGTLVVYYQVLDDICASFDAPL